MAVEAPRRAGAGGRLKTYTLPWPPPVNAAFQPVIIGRFPKARATIIKTDVYRAYEKLIAQLFGPRTGHSSPPIKLSIRLFRPRRTGDIDGPFKVVFDCLNGRAWDDDSQIVELHVVRGDDPIDPRVEVDVEPALFVDTGKPARRRRATAEPARGTPQLSFIDYRGAH